LAPISTAVSASSNDVLITSEITVGSPSGVNSIPCIGEEEGEEEGG